MKFLKALFIVYFILLFNLNISAEDKSWAQKTLDEMSMEEKIGQLFMVAGYIDTEFGLSETGHPNIIQEIDHYMTQFHAGGIAFVGPSDSENQVTLTNHYQKLSKYPLLIAQDLEWGLSMRLKDTIRYPKNITLGAIKNNELIYEMGKEIGRQAKLIGVHMNLSPVLDINSEPENVAINVRSFSDSPQLVAEKGIAMIQGLQDAGMIASAKHFPGLGDIKVDPHLALPYSFHEKKRILEMELYPFIRAIEAGVLSIQTEHLMLPTIDPIYPTSLSYKMVTELLKNELGFTGLILSGALRMKALTENFSEEEIILNAFLAGSDMLLMPQDFPKAYQILKNAWNERKISEKEVDQKVLKILQIKEKANLHKEKFVEIPKQEALNNEFGKSLKRRLYKQAVHVIRNRKSLIPFNLSNKDKIAYVQLGDPSSKILFEKLTSFLPSDTFIFPLMGDVSTEKERLFSQIDQYSAIIIAVHPANPRRIAEIRLLNKQHQTEELEQFRVHGIPKNLIPLINTLKEYEKKTIICFFGSPFGLSFFEDFSTCVMAYEDDFETQDIVSELLFEEGKD